MTHFESTYLLTKQSNILNSINISDNQVNEAYQKQKQDIAIQMEYRELDRLIMELKKEMQAIKAIRAEMEQYKKDFNLTVEDEATKKIEEVIKRIDNILK